MFELGTRSFATAVVAILAMNTSVSADGPAVSDVNTKLSIFGGSAGDPDGTRGLGGLAGSLTMPLGYSYGLQIDGAYARIGDGNFGSTGGHLFWRDPTRGLVGVYAGYARLDRFGGIDVGRVGGEAQHFEKQITLDGAAGFKFGDIKDQAYGRARLQFYVTDNLMLQSGWSYEGRNFGTVGTEFQLATGPSAGISLFADAQINDNSHFAALGGLKVTFGKNMTLKDRHRRQDPDSYTFSDQQTTQQGAAAANARQLAQQGRTPALTTTPACPSGGALFSPTLNCTCPTGTTKNTTITLSGTQASCGPATNL